ncbi:hypothetical protein GOBAR_DD36316 [Gossypium barbadense]|nr:hypothetical protein GOBAR_DD36316 [Gossypium barbadense]
MKQSPGGNVPLKNRGHRIAGVDDQRRECCAGEMKLCGCVGRQRRVTGKYPRLRVGWGGGSLFSGPAPNGGHSSPQFLGWLVCQFTYCPLAVEKTGGLVANVGEVWSSGLPKFHRLYRFGGLVSRINPAQLILRALLQYDVVPETMYRSRVYDRLLKSEEVSDNVPWASKLLLV